LLYFLSMINEQARAERFARLVSFRLKC